ncbi:hypothetical protein C1645_774885 [Glomus cerebriforme]|uniref:Uncharacterized protein n=1 Tax=Glomus cerebriforme TaxID=658196 RepID=A0A397SUY5_9GLOM|nr:hypothetical protein C1645_774885 [Glomus cerebriforme]
MNPLQPQYFSARTFLELKGDKKFVFIDHPSHGQHRFPLPTKEEISKDYSYYSESSKKKWINSFMIFRTYLQKSKQNYLILSEVSKIASDAWAYATKDVLEACNELETELKESFKYKRFVPYSHQRPKKLKKHKSPSSKKKESSSSDALTSSEETIYLYPSPAPSMTATPIFPDLMYSDLTPEYSPLSLQTPPMCIIEAPKTMPLLTIGPPAIPLPPQESEISFSPMFSADSGQNQSSLIFPLTPLQIFCDFDTNFLGSGFTSSTSRSLTSNLEISETNSFGEGLTLNTTTETAPTQFTITLNETATESEIASMEAPSISSEDERKCINELFDHLI